MRKRAMVLGLILVPLATGGAVLLAKNSNQSSPAPKATISLPVSEDTPSEYSPSEGPGFVLAPSVENAEPRDLKQQQSEEQRERETPLQPNSEDVDSDHAAAEVLFASENTSAEEEIGDEPQHVASSARGWFNSYAFANGRRSNGSGGSGVVGGGSGASGGSTGSAPSADTKSPQSNSSSDEEPASGVQGSHPLEVPNDQTGSDDTHDGSVDGSVEDPVADDSDGDDTTDEETPPQVTPVPYFPPVDERPHVTVPEPSTLMLLGLGLLACAAASRRRRVKVK